jgi:hypothetical protein
MSETGQTDRSRRTDWIWWSVLIVSCVVGFGLTMFAPT